MKATSRRRSFRPHIMVGMSLVIAAAIWLFVAAPSAQRGEQLDGPLATTLRLAEPDGWIALSSGTERPGFPEPMVWTTDGVCVGFGRVDFAPDDRRPSLARCRSDDFETTIRSHMIRPLVSVTSGFDTWHFLEAADPVEGVRIQLDGGHRLEAERIYIGGSTIALRLENGRDLASFEWSTIDSTYRCTPDPTAWLSSVFCTDS